MIGKQICIRRVGLILVLGMLLYSWDVSSLKHRTTEENTMVERDSFDIDDDDVAELLWLNCRSEILEIKYITEDVDLCILQDQGADGTNALNLKCQTEGKEKLREFLSMLRPEYKLSLTDCLRRNGLLPFEYINSKAKEEEEEEEEEDVWVNDEVESLSSRLPINHIRRSLASSKRSRSKKRKAEHQKIIIIAMAATASVTFLLAMLLFLCFYKCYGSGSDDGHNDEKPLLCLSSNDRSSGSSHRRYGSGDLLKDGQVEDQQLKNMSSSKTLSSSSFSSGKNNGSDAIIVTADLKPQTSGRVSSALEVQPAEGNLLPPPPGRAVSSLKPPQPTGKAEPPEPPVPPKPLTPTKTAPPPPPPPPASNSASASASASAPAPAPPPPPPPASGGRKPSGPPPPPPPAPGGKRVGPPPPPQPKGGGGGPGRPPTQPFTAGKFGKAPPLAPNSLGRPEDHGNKTKLKPFFWDKVLANPNSSMVWDQLKAGSFQFNEEMIESLFGYNADNNNKNKKEIKKDSSQDPSNTIIQIIDPKKSQNLSILLKALNVTIQEVCDALLEGNELPIEFLQTVLKMAPTQEEELKLRLFNGEVSQLGTADRFLKSLVDIPFAFKRMEALVFMITLEEEVTFAKESFENLEVACKELRSSRLFLKLLEAVLKTGNRMNSGTYRGGAQAFKLDTLLKLVDVRGADGKTTLLHFVVQEIIRSEGIRAARAARESLSFSSIKSEDLFEDVAEESEDYYRSLGLQVVSGLGDGLENVKKAAGIDADNLTGTVAKLGHAIMRTREFMNTDMKNLQEESGFHNTLKSFVKNAETDVMWLLEEEKRIMALVKTTADYFHGNTGKDEGLRLFVIVRDFLVILDKVCRQVKDAPKKKQVQKKDVVKGPSLAPSSSDSRLKESPTTTGPKLAPSSSDSSLPMSLEMRQRFFPAIQQQRNGGGGDSSSSSSSSSSSDDE